MNFFALFAILSICILFNKCYIHRSIYISLNRFMYTVNRYALCTLDSIRNMIFKSWKTLTYLNKHNERIF